MANVLYHHENLEKKINIIKNFKNINDTIKTKLIKSELSITQKSLQ